MVGASAIVAINNARQADSCGVLLVLGVAAACALFLIGLLAWHWISQTLARRRREQAGAYVRIIGKSLADLPMKIERKP